MESERRISSNSSGMLSNLYQPDANSILFPPDAKYVECCENQNCLHLEDIWKNIFPYLRLEAILPLRETSGLTRKVAAQFILKQLPTKKLLELKNSSDCQKLLSDEETKISSKSKSLILKELVRRLNENEIDIYHIFPDPSNCYLSEWIDFFSDECAKLEKIELINLDRINIEEISKRFPNLKDFKVHTFTSCPLDIPNLEEAKLINTSSSSNSETKFESVTSLDLSDVKEPKKLKILLTYFPNITKLDCSYFEVNVFKYLTNHTQLQHVILKEWCDYEVEVEEEEDGISLPSVTHLELNSTDIPINLLLPSLTQLSLVSIKTYPDFVYGNPEGEVEMPRDEVQMPSLLAVLESSPLLKTLLLKDCLPMNLISLKDLLITDLTIREDPSSEMTEKDFGNQGLSVLHNFTSIETLTIEGVEVEDFSVLAGHPNLKKLIIINCTNMDTAEALKNKGIEVIYND